ncbi:MAG TPA: carboxypeptidase-like regulatory domain-containing protein [Tepidisphaeraceae bacterium]|jgi:hypothetical protein
MRSSLKWGIPTLAAVALMVGWSLRPARAEDAAPPTTQPGKCRINGIAMYNGQPAVGAMIRLMKPVARGATPAAETPKADQQAQDSTPKAGKANAKGAKANRPEPVATATADANGQFSLTDVPPGNYVVAAAIKGQAVGRARVHVSDGQTVSVNIELRERPVPKQQL